MATVLAREGTIGRTPWKQLLLVENERVIVLDLVPALLSGWNVRAISTQDDAWEGMSEAEILAWKERAEDSCARPVTESERAFVLAKLGRAA